MRQRTGARLLLVLARVLGPGTFEGSIGYDIPCVVDADEQEQHRSRRDDEQGRCRVTWEQNRRDDEGGVGDQRQDPLPHALANPESAASTVVTCQASFPAAPP